MNRFIKRLFVTVLLIALAVTSIPADFAAAFGDTTGHWAESYIDTIKPLGVINGYPDGTFRPDTSVKRIEFIAIIVNALKLPLRAATPNEYWGAPYAESALTSGLINDTEYGGITESSLEKSITREEMSSIVVNAFYSRGKTISETQKSSALSSLSDFNTVSSEYYDQSVAAVALGIINGYPDGTFGPTKTATRAHAAVMSQKLLTEIGVLQGNTPTATYSVSGIKLGDSYDSVIKLAGQPVREDSSEYGFKWLVYHSNYKSYYQIGIQNNKVVALYTASDLLSGKSNVTIGQTKSEVTKLLGTPLSYIQKGTTQYQQYNTAETAVYLKDNAYVTAYFDTTLGGKLFAVKVVDYSVEQAMKRQYGTASDALRISYEKTIFDLANVFRVSNGKPILAWHEGLANVARKHSKDMAVRSFFDHINPSGYSPFDRILADGIDYSVAAENIAAGYTNAFAAHSGWVNSPGHRENLLRQIDYLGVGIYIGGEYVNYFTQDFITP